MVMVLKRRTGGEGEAPAMKREHLPIFQNSDMQATILEMKTNINHVIDFCSDI